MNRTNVVLDLISQNEWQEIAENYASLPSIEPLDHEIAIFAKIVAYSLDHYKNVHDRPTIEYVTGQPYPNADTMRLFLDLTHSLQVSTDYNEPTSIMSKETNLLFRATHDLHHCSTGDCNFNLWGELCAYSKFAYDALDYCSNARINPQKYVRWLACEIIGQVCYLRVYGEFPEQKLNNCVSDVIIDRILGAYAE